MAEQPLKLDIGCGKNKKEGFTGVDQYPMEGVDHVFKIGAAQWPFESGSVDEAHASHFIEHLTAAERVHFCNELHRVLKPGAQATIIAPHWASNRAYGDPTHQWPPVSEMWFYYLNRDWRRSQAPHTDVEWNSFGFSCHFQATWGYSVHPTILLKEQSAQQYALSFYKEAAQDIVATLTKL